MASLQDLLSGVCNLGYLLCSTLLLYFFTMDNPKDPRTGKYLSLFDIVVLPAIKRIPQLPQADCSNERKEVEQATIKIQRNSQ